MSPEEAKTALNYKKYIALDTESTNFQPNDNYGLLLEIGAVKIIDNKIVDRFDELINPGMPIPKKIIELTGITDEMVKDKDNYVSVLTKFRNWCDSDDFIFLMHNAPHDIKFLNFFGKKANLKFNDPCIDTHTLAKNLLHKNWNDLNSRVNENYKLQTLATFYNIQDNNHHRALNDAEVTWNVYDKLRQTAFKLNPYLIDRQYFKYPTKEKTDEQKLKVKMISACPWDKKPRLYIKLSLEQENRETFSTIFYDFEYKCWKIKESGFPIKSFSNIEKSVKELFQTDKMDFYFFNEPKYLKDYYLTIN